MSSADKYKARTLKLYFDPNIMTEVASRFPPANERFSTTHGKEILGRVAGSRDATESFYFLAPDNRKQWLIMSACVEAANLMHTLKPRLARAEAFSRKLLKLRDAAKDLQSYLDHLAEPADFLPFEMILGSAAIETAKKGISGLWPWLEQCRAYERA
jgi:hypothetical protein